jgi:hypothetical protein
MTKNNQNYILYDKFKNCGGYKGQEEGQLTSDNIHYNWSEMMEALEKFIKNGVK